MDLPTFKANILKGQAPTQLVVLLCAENFFIADQYINTLCKKTGKEKNIINSIFEQQSISVFLQENNLKYYKSYEVLRGYY